MQRNQIFQGLGAIHNDPYATLQYGAQAIRADVAHRWATGKGVTVAVVDTGVDTEHADLHGRIVKAVNFVEGGERTFAQDSHGTAVAGIIAAKADNEVGIFGIAPEADVVAVKACWQRAPGALEAVCSSWTLAKAVDGGIAVVAAAAEEGEQAPGFPASLEEVIAVVASDTHGQVRSAVAMKRITLLAAPGIDILTTAPRQAYDFFSGSSLAAAHVSGIAALLLESEPRLSPGQVSTILRATAQAVKVASSASQAAIGQVDACNALGKLLGQPICP